MANSAYATETGSQDLGTRVTAAAKRVFAAFVRSREREAMMRVQSHLTAAGHPLKLENGHIKTARRT